MRKPAEVFPLCHFLTEELQERGWTAADIVNRTCLNEDRVRAILAGERISLREAEALGLAFGVSGAMFLNLQLAWQKAQPKE